MIKAAKSVLRKTAIGCLNKKFESGSLQMLLIIGHMRSGSSLLVHILNSNPDIIGYGETHRPYRTKSDFGKTAFKIYRAFKTLPKNEKYVLDKVLHSYHIKDISVLKETKVIISLREPREALPSIHALDPGRFPPPATFKHYKDRIENIQLLVRTLEPGNWICTTYNELINHSGEIFSRIETLLNINHQLSKKYKTIWATGKKGIGDPSNTIEQGTIIKKKSQRKLPDTLKPYLKDAKLLYNNCLEELKQKSRY